MAEIQLVRIKSIYGDLKGLISQIPSLKESALVSEFIVEQINSELDNLSDKTSSDYSTYKIPDSQRNHNWPKSFQAGVVRVQLGRVISKLEEEYGFGQATETESPGIVIVNKNENEISLQINYTINDLIDREDDKESKSKLIQLDKELKKPNKDWDAIKKTLVWILNFSKELFLEIIPIILQKKL